MEGARRLHGMRGGAAATQHLIDLGHKQIGHLRGGINDEKNFVVPALRSAAFEATMRRAGLELRPEWNVAGDYTVGQGWRRPPSSLTSRGSAPRPFLRLRRDGARGHV